MLKLLALLVIVAVTWSSANGAECYYCAAGSASDIMQLSDVYGNAELSSNAFPQSTRAYNEDCGKNAKGTLKTVKCPHGCIIAEYANKSTIAGCARDGMVLLGVSTYTNNDEHFRMAVCSNDECNESFDSAKVNRPKPTGPPSTTTTTTTMKPSPSPKDPKSVGKTTSSEEKKSAEADVPTVPTPRPKPKPSFASSVGSSMGALAAGVLLYFYSI